MYAVIETGGKQYNVKQGDVIYVEKLTAEEGSNVEFKTIALFGEGKLSTGNAVNSAKVVGKVLKNSTLHSQNALPLAVKKYFHQNYSVHRQVYYSFLESLQLNL